MKRRRGWVDRSRDIALACLAVLGLSVALVDPIRRGDHWVAAAVAVGVISSATLFIITCRRNRQVLRDLRTLTRWSQRVDVPLEPIFFKTSEVSALALLWPAAPVVPPTPPDPTGERPVLLPHDQVEPSSGDFEQSTPGVVGTVPPTDMVGSLAPNTFRWLRATPSLTHFLGLSLGDLETGSFLDSVHEDDRELAREQLLAAQAKGEAHGLIYRVVNKTGQARIMELHVGVRFGDDRQPLYLRFRAYDATARVRASRELKRRTRELTRANVLLREANQELEELSARYSDLYENAPAMYFQLDPDHHFELCNKTLLNTLGYEARDLIGKPSLSLVAPERLPFIPSLRDEFRRVGQIEVETRWVAADGRTLDVHVTVVAILDQEGRPIGSRGVARDVTEYKRLEATLRERNARLAQAVTELSRKNRELDEFGHVVSHDLQEPLRTLIAFSDFLLKDHGDRLDENGRQYVSHIVNASRRMRTLIADLLELSRAGKVTGEFAPVETSKLIETIRADLAELTRMHEGSIVVHDPLPTLWGDGPRLGQLLTNLISNGLKYRGDAPPVVQVSAVDDGPGWTLLSVRDNGIGIDPRHHEKVFQLFRRLHPRDQYEGNGAGLAICRKVAQAHGGDIRVESESGQGATFQVRLPVANGHPQRELVREPERVHA